MAIKQRAIDTIFALSSAFGKAGVAVIRVSGALAWESVNILTNADLDKNKTVLEPNKARLLDLSYPASCKTKKARHIDKALVVGFKAPKSFTGEDVVEYHCHGSPAIIEEMFEALKSIKGCRMAQHGEFTRRAFENGKLDLTEAEAVADLIDAETCAQKDQALAQMGGALSTLYHDWAERLTRSFAYVEAIIDFPDEDISDDETAKAFPEVKAVSREITQHLDDDRRGERLRNGLRIAVIGAPNVGKSSLVNILAQRDAAIVSDMAGTTRDVIEVHLNLGGYPVIVADTAGLRPDQIGKMGQEAIESEGIRRALKYAQEADLKLLVFDASAEKPDKHTLDLLDKNSVVLLNKGDLFEGSLKDLHILFHVKQDTKNIDPLVVSTVTEQGLDAFLDVLTSHVADMMAVSCEAPALTRQRHRTNLEECAGFLESALNQTQPELIAQELRFAVNALGRITGRVDVEDLLDVIFKDFCIGK